MDLIPKFHWTNFLSEVGEPVLRMGIHQLMILERIRRKQAEIEALRIEFQDSEEIIIDTVSDDWTKEEIEIAKEKTTKQL